MIKTHELNDSRSCLSKTGLDEPIFVLRARTHLPLLWLSTGLG